MKVLHTRYLPMASVFVVAKARFVLRSPLGCHRTQHHKRHKESIIAFHIPSVCMPNRMTSEEQGTDKLEASGCFKLDRAAHG